MSFPCTVHFFFYRFERQDQSDQTVQVQQAAAELQTLTAKLIEAAGEVGQARTPSKGSDERTEHAVAMQRLEMRRREWAAKVRGFGCVRLLFITMSDDTAEKGVGIQVNIIS